MERNDLQGMKARAGGDVEIEIGVVHAVQAPEQRHGVHHDVLQVNHEVHGNHGHHHGQPVRRFDIIENAPALFLGKQRHADRGGGKQQAQHHGIEHHDAKVAAPAHGLGDAQGPGRRQDLPQRHDGEDTEKEPQADDGLVAQDKFIKIHTLASCCK